MVPAKAVLSMRGSGPSNSAVVFMLHPNPSSMNLDSPDGCYLTTTQDLQKKQPSPVYVLRSLELHESV